MAGMYHINGEGVTPCKATKGNCPFGQGEENNHFADAGEAMAVFEYRLAKEYDGGLGSTKKATVCPVCGKPSPCGENDHLFAPATTEPDEEAAALAEPKFAKDLAAEGADPKAVRDALRTENPTWTNQQVHVVSKAMITNSSPEAKKAAASATTQAPASARTVAGLFLDYNAAHKLKASADEAMDKTHATIKAHDLAHGVAEGRAYHIGRGGKMPGMNPNGGSTYFERTPEQKAAIDKAQEQVKNASQAIRDAQTAVEEAGAGYRIPDEGNTVRVRTQAQKWLMENELKGQISDGQWENTQPQDHWKDWTDAKVIVDPKNPGRNFHAIKDNYQLNARDLLDAVGDRMVDEVKASSGKDYDDKAMAKDLTDLRKIFKTHRAAVK